MNKLVILGAGGHGKVIADIAENVGYTDIVFLDDHRAAGPWERHQVVGKCKEASSYPCADFIVAVGNASIRRKLQSELKEMGVNLVTLIHPAAVIASDVKIGVGTAVMAGAVVNPGTEIGQGCIINTCASVDHDCRIGDFVHVSVGAHAAGTVTIGDNTMVGAGAIIINNIEVTSDCMIGAGAVVVRDIMESDTYTGVPARRMVRKGKTDNREETTLSGDSPCPPHKE